MKRQTTISDHLIPLIALPFSVVIVIPFLLNRYFDQLRISQLTDWDHSTLFLLGAFFFFPGIVLFVNSIRLFHKIGNGTLAPWKPTQKLVVKGLYSRVRNPMITGVLLLLLSESFLYNSLVVLLWLIIFFCSCSAFFILFEEPDLQNRFGKEYRQYKENVPRWIPRFRPWKPD